MRFMFPTMLDVGQSLQLYMSELVATESDLEMKDILARYTTDVIGKCAFGIACNRYAIIVLFKIKNLERD